MERLIWYRDNPIMPTQQSVADWLRRLQPTDIKRLEHKNAVDFDTFRQSLWTSLIAKDTTKSKGEDTASVKQNGMQGISFLPKENVATSSPLEGEIIERTIAILRSNNMWYTKSNVHTVTELIRANGAADEPNPMYVEMDQARYDKSQSERPLLIEYIWYCLMGLSREFLVLWERMCSRTSLTSMEGLKLLIDFQRKSGYFNTLGGNTVINWVTAHGELDLDDAQYVGVIGDDSVARLSTPIETGLAEDRMAQVWNLSAQVSQFKHGYFCSSFIIHTFNVCAMMPDPLKRLQKLQSEVKMVRRDPKDPKKILDPIHEKWISFADNMQSYQNDVALYALDVAVMERYGGGFPTGTKSIRPLLLCLATLAIDEQQFAACFTYKVVINNV